MTVSITSNHSKDLGRGPSGNLAHNRRDFIPHNVDRSLIGNNIVFKSRTLAEVYDETFGDAIDDYNRKQKRKGSIKYDRKSYFKRLFGADPESESAKVILTSNARGKYEIKSFNEELFQVGDCMVFGHFKRDKHGNFIDKNGNPVKWNKKKQMYYDINGNAVTDSSNLIPNPNAEIAKRILSDFYEGGRFKAIRDINGKLSLKRIEENDTEEQDLVIPSFEERNPNFRITYAVMHNDEWHGTPQIHIDYVPVGEGYIKGPEKQLGFERALKNMGFEDKNTAYKEWREKERQILKEICNYYGLETKTKEEEQENNRKKTYAPDIYAKTLRDALADAQEEAEKIRKKAEEDAKAIIDKAVKDASVIRGRAEMDAEAVKKQADEYAQAVKDEALEEAAQIISSAEQEAAELQAENKSLTENNEKLQLDIEDKEKQLCDVDKQLIMKSDIAANIPEKEISKKSLKERVGNLTGRIFKGSPASDEDYEKHTLTKQEHAEYTAFYEFFKPFVQNKIIFDEDVEELANELQLQKQMTANMQQDIQQQATQRAELMIQQTIDELDDKKQEYEKLCKKQKGYIMRCANKIVVQILQN